MVKVSRLKKLATQEQEVNIDKVKDDLEETGMIEEVLYICKSIVFMISDIKHNITKSSLLSLEKVLVENKILLEEVFGENKIQSMIDEIYIAPYSKESEKRKYQALEDFQSETKDIVEKLLKKDEFYLH
jgi:hypothetical protein